MQSPVYFTAMIGALLGLWFVWDLGVRKLLLDSFRERLFELRFELFQMAAKGEVAFDDEAYRAIEILISGLLRFAHRVTLLGFIVSLREQMRAKKANEFVDYHQQIELKISRTSPSAQENMRRIIGKTNEALVLYMSCSSLICLALAPVFILLKVFGLSDRRQHDVGVVFESEVYRAESQRGQLITA